MSFLEMLKLSFSFCEEQSEDEEIRVHAETHKQNTAHLSSRPVEGGTAHTEQEKHTRIFTSNSVSTSGSTRYPVNLGSSRYCKLPQSK